MLHLVNDHQDRWAAVGRAVKTARLERGWTRSDLVRTSAVSEPVIREIEQGKFGKRQPGVLGKLARALGWPADAFDRLLDGEDAREFVREPSSVIAAIEADPRLSPVSREILIGAYKAAVGH